MNTTSTIQTKKSKLNIVIPIVLLLLILVLVIVLAAVTHVVSVSGIGESLVIKPNQTRLGTLFIDKGASATLQEGSRWIGPSAGGYRRERPGTAVEGGPPRLYAFLYDWRRDLADAARALDGLIEQVRADHGQPGLQVDLVAHSGGGLVARYYLLHGGRPLDQDATGRPDFAGAAKVNSVVAVGVPELGMARAAAALMEGEPVVLSRILPGVLFTTQSNFQLLPHGDDTWLVDGAGSPIAADRCDLGLWRQLGAGIFDSAVRARVRDAARSLRESIA